MISGRFTHMRVPVSTVTAVVLSLLFVCGGCSRESSDHSLPSPPPTMAELENMTYRSFITDSGRVRLQNGSAQVWNRRAGQPISVTLTQYRLIGAFADKNGGAAVILRTAPGGPATFFDLAVVVRKDTMARNIALASLGDRVRIRALSLENGHIILQMTTHAPKDQMCCPTRDVRNTYQVRGEKLLLLKSEPDER